MENIPERIVRLSFFKPEFKIINACLLFLFIIIAPFQISFAAGELDSGFGGDGRVSTVFPISDFRLDGIAEAVAVQPDGKILAVGTGQSDKIFEIGILFVLVRCNADGSLDDSFGDSGIVVTDITPGQDTVRSVAVQADGKILVGGSEAYGNENFALARYNSDGRLDPGFGSGGKVFTDFDGRKDRIHSLAVLDDGRIVAMGESTEGLGWNAEENIALARYQADGSLDSSFGTDGRVRTSFSENVHSYKKVVVQADGKLVVVGTVEPGEIGLVRYNGDGSPDDSFGTNGLLITDYSGGRLTGADLVLAADGKLVAAGTAENSDPGVADPDFILARFSPDGSLDSSFGQNGWARSDLGGQDNVTSMGIQTGGRYVLQGFSTSGPVLARFNSDGSLDTDFGSDGLVSTAPDDFHGKALGLEPDGRIVVAGNIYDETDFTNQFALVGYQSDGTPNTGFGEDGLAAPDLPLHTASILGLSATSEGKILAGGRVSTSGAMLDLGLARYNPDGTPDVSFGSSGLVATGVFGDGPELKTLAFTPDGQCVAVGLVQNESFIFYDFFLARFNADGSRDSSFGSDGTTTASFGENAAASAVVIQPDGKILVAGAIRPENSYSEEFAVARFNTDGSVDAGFGQNGAAITDFNYNAAYGMANAILVQPDGKIVAGGSAIPEGSLSDDFVLARYNPDGSLDSGFGDGGKVNTDFDDKDQSIQTLALMPDGKILAAGKTMNENNNADFALARYNPDGSLDTTFGAGGKVTTDFNGGTDIIVDLVVQDSRDIVVIGGDPNRTLEDSDFFLVRYRENGSLDKPFGMGGRAITDFFGGRDFATTLLLLPDDRVIIGGSVESGPSTGMFDFGLAQYLAGASSRSMPWMGILLND